MIHKLKTGTTRNRPRSLSYYHILIGRKPNMSAVINKSMVADINLGVLKRIDPEIEQVLGTAAHVCLYAMTMDNPVWVSGMSSDSSLVPPQG